MKIAPRNYLVQCTTDINIENIPTSKKQKDRGRFFFRLTFQ